MFALCTLSNFTNNQTEASPPTKENEMKHLNWSMSKNDKSINGVCRTVADAHALLQKLSQMTTSDITITINAETVGKGEAIAQVSDVVASAQAKHEQTHRAIHVKTGACAFAANTKKVWIKR